MNECWVLRVIYGSWFSLEVDIIVDTPSLKVLKEYMIVYSVDAQLLQGIPPGRPITIHKGQHNLTAL